MPTYDLLRSLFRDIALAALAAQSAACVLGPEDGPIDRSGFDRDLCSGGALEGVTPSIPVDYLAIREVSRHGAGVPPKLLEELGTRCANASSSTACEDALASLPGGGFVSGEAEWTADRAVLYTRGDEVGVLGSEGALREFLAPIETERDAALIAELTLEQQPSCGRGPNARVTEDAVEIITLVGQGCKYEPFEEHLLRYTRDGEVRIVRSAIVGDNDRGCIVPGRLTTGLAVTTTRKCTALGAHLAEMAAFEEAAVYAFERLARELASLGAPRVLVDRASASADDARRHARDVGALAARFGGGRVDVTCPADLPLRDAYAIAIENAAEGCVGETYAALVATHQAESAQDPVARKVLARIAIDETKHAALSLDVARFLDARLTSEERVHVARAHAEAAHGLGKVTLSHLHEAARSVIGLPNEVAGRALHTALERTLWASPFPGVC